MSGRTVWVAKVEKGDDGMLQAKMNPAISASERTYLAAMCAGMFAKLAGEGILGLSEELAKKPRVLRP